VYGDPQSQPEWEVWHGVRDRLASDRMKTILRAGVAGAQDYVYLASKVPNDLPDMTKPWGRLVIIPGGGGVVTLEPASDHALPRRVTLRADFHDYKAQGYNVEVGLGAAMAEAYNRLDGWSASFTRARITQAFWVERPAQEYPQRDAQTGLLYLSAVYRCEIGAVPA
jgi:hypothetical protein